MARAAKNTQIAPQAAPVARPVDRIAERLIAAGLVPNEWLLDLNGSLTTPDEFRREGIWQLPSRLFTFPIRVSRFDGVNDRVLTLSHPLLADHPFVQHVEGIFGVRLAAEGRSNTWFHACDLIEKHWEKLLETRQFTTDDDIGCAIGFALRSFFDDSLTTQAARKMLGAVEAPEPSDAVALLFCLAQPMSLTDTSVRWPINGGHSDGIMQAWTFIIGIERGWFAYQGRSLQWTPAGRDRYAAGPDGAFVLSASGQAAFDF